MYQSVCCGTDQRVVLGRISVLLVVWIFVHGD